MRLPRLAAVISSERPGFVSGSVIVSTAGSVASAASAASCSWAMAGLTAMSAIVKRIDIGVFTSR